MEWQNVTAGYDLDAAWAVSAEHLIRRGYVWVGVSAQMVGVHFPNTGLRAWSPTRYGTLDVTIRWHGRQRRAMLRHLFPGRTGSTPSAGNRPARRPAGEAHHRSGRFTVRLAPGHHRPGPSRLPWVFVLNAALDHLSAWITTVVEPPQALDIEVTSVGPPAVVARDELGNALGGIRLSQHAVPTATNTGVNSSPEPLSFCAYYGTHIPFTEDRLHALYPNHRAYVGAYSNIGK